MAVAILEVVHLIRIGLPAEFKTQRSTKAVGDIASPSKLGTGFYKINYAEPHPDGTNVIVLAMGEGISGSAWNVVNNANSTTYANTATSTTFIWRDQNMNATDARFSFVVLAP